MLLEDRVADDRQHRPGEACDQRPDPRDPQERPGTDHCQFRKASFPEKSVANDIHDPDCAEPSQKERRRDLLPEHEAYYAGDNCIGWKRRCRRS